VSEREHNGSEPGDVGQVEVKLFGMSGAHTDRHVSGGFGISVGGGGGGGGIGGETFSVSSDPSQLPCFP